MKKVFTFLLLITCLTIVKAYNNDYFSIEIPEGYNETINDNMYKWSKDNKYIAVTINNNTNKYNIEKYTDKDLETQKKHLEETYSKELKEYDVKVDVSDVKRNTINNYSVLEYNLYWDSKDYIGYNMYQKGIIYTTKNYIYTFIYSSDEEINNEEFTSTINSFKLKDEPISHISPLLVYILVVGTLLGIIGFIVDTIRKKKEHK